MQDLIGDVDITGIEHSFGGKWRAKRQEKKAQKDERRANRKATNRADRTANQLQKINARKTGGGFIERVGAAAKEALGAGAGAGAGATDTVYDDRGFEIGYTDPNQAALDAQKKTQNTIIIVVVIVVVIVVIALFVLKSKKKKAA